jgi:hypothetical protein
LAGALGFLLLAAGLIGGGTLYVLSEQRHDKAVEQFARAAVGCTTTLEFNEIGTFYVYEETGGRLDPAPGCTPAATAEAFKFEVSGPAGVAPRSDDSITYDTDAALGRSVARFVIATPGRYEMEVRGDDPSVVAAIGRDPSDGVSEMRRGALVVALGGVGLGALLLVVAGMRSRKAATITTPVGPGWGSPPGGQHTWPPAPPRVPQVPVNPHQPDRPAEVTPPPPPLPARTTPGSTLPTRSPWAPPSVDARVDAADPVEPERPVTPMPRPVLPDTPGQATRTDR